MFFYKKIKPKLYLLSDKMNLLIVKVNKHKEVTK